MKKILLKTILSLLLFTFTKCSPSGQLDPVDKFVIQTANKLSQKYNMHLCAFGGEGGKMGVSVVSISFERRGKPLDFTEGRKLIINIAEDFLFIFNQNEEIRPYLKEWPFTCRNINIHLHFYDHAEIPILDPYLAAIAVFRTEIGFFTQDPLDRYKYKQKIYEPYEEALAIVRGEKE